MVVNSEITELLVDLGLSDYEARAYASLMRCQPATAYELAKQAGIPSSKIYEAVKRLQAKGLAQPVSADTDRGQRYMALNPDDFIYLKREETARKTARLAPLLSQLSNGADADFVWQLSGADPVFDKARQLICQSTDYLLVSLWPEELEALATDLEEAEKRGVRIALVHFGLPGKKIGATFHHPAEETLYEEKGGRGLTLVADGHGVMTATFSSDGRVEGAWSRNHAFTILAEDYVRHDVYITKLTATMDAEIKERFGDNYQDLRDVFKPVE